MNGFKKLCTGMALTLALFFTDGCAANVATTIAAKVAGQAVPDINDGSALLLEALGPTDNLYICYAALGKVTAAYAIADRPVPEDIKNQIHIFYDVARLRIIQATTKAVVDTINANCQAFAQEVLMAVATGGRSAGPGIPQGFTPPEVPKVPKVVPPVTVPPAVAPPASAVR
jgi:hypothetical protein